MTPGRDMQITTSTPRAPLSRHPRSKTLSASHSSLQQRSHGTILLSPSQRHTHRTLVILTRRIRHWKSSPSLTPTSSPVWRWWIQSFLPRLLRPWKQEAIKRGFRIKRPDPVADTVPGVTLSHEMCLILKLELAGGTGATFCWSTSRFISNVQYRKVKLIGYLSQYQKVKFTMDTR